eukprot:COSAG01_NODE_1405_length_10451_cov_8.718998_7_plen_87_part_00
MPLCIAIAPTARRKMVAPELRFLALAAMAATARAQGTAQVCTYAHTFSSLWFAPLLAACFFHHYAAAVLCESWESRSFTCVQLMYA